jgi:hypothetical protein
VHQERAIRDAVDLHAVEVADLSHDLLGMAGIDARDGHVADDGVALDAHEVDRSEHRVRGGDRVGHAGERVALLREVQAHREAVRRRRLQARRRRGLLGHGFPIVPIRATRPHTRLQDRVRIVLRAP